MGFFDHFPAFFETSHTGASSNRLNKRFEAIFETDRTIFAGANVLDIASHDGRWSFAAIKAGASRVTGVEPRRHLVEHANETFRKYNVAKEAYSFEQEDVFRYLRHTEEVFDVVLCLGFFYHTYRHPELLSLIKKVNPSHLIVDSRVIKAKGLICDVRKDRVEQEFEAYEEDSSYEGMTYVAAPSLPLLRDMLSHFRFDITEVDWNALVGESVHGIGDYADGRRATLICRAV
jgi:cyclopropane fatty-acyl-phospholipid synthase-like methyltransferase